MSLLKSIDLPTLHKKHSLLFFPCDKFPAPFENVLSSKQHLIKYVCLYFSQNIHFMQFVRRDSLIVCDIISLQDIQGNFQLSTLLIHYFYFILKAFLGSATFNQPMTAHPLHCKPLLFNFYVISLV